MQQLYTCKDESVAKKTRAILTKKSNKAISPAQVVESVIKTFADSSCIQSKQESLKRGKTHQLTRWTGKTDISEIIEENGKIVIIVKNKIVKPEPKKLDEARGIVTADTRPTSRNYGYRS